MRIRFLTTLCLLAILSSAAFADPVKQTGMWSGIIEEGSLRKLAPKAGFIADDETWKKLWTAWRSEENLPKANFSRELILVGTVPGPNHVLMQPTIQNGDVKFLVAGTRIGGPGFGYKLIKISRTGVKTVNGNAVTEEKPAVEDSITVQVVGTLRTGLFAIGGETTGTTITAKGITWELDFGDNAELRRSAEKLDGKKVTVQGSLARRRGVEIKERWIVTVTEMKAAGDGGVGGRSRPQRNR